MTEIWVICKDPGGVACVLPVAEKFQANGQTVQIITNGKAAELLKGKENIIAVKSMDQLRKKIQHLPSLIITSMCSGGGIGRDLADEFKGEIPVIAVQDFWGARLLTDWKNTGPTIICVNDKIGAKIVSKCWPDFPLDNIRITGYPSLDKYAEYNPEISSIKKSLGLAGKEQIVLFVGTGKFSGEMLQEVVISLNSLNKEICLIARMHPRMKDDFPEEVLKWNKALSEFQGMVIICPECAMQQLIAASTVVTSISSTALVEAAVARNQNIAILYPESGMKNFREITGGAMEEFPLIELQCSVKAENREMLIRLLELSLKGGLNLRKRQEEVFLLDGKNAERVCEIAHLLL